MSNSISVEVIAAKILLIRGKRVILDKDLARLYEVETGQLTRQVRRNIDRFPEDFMFQLTKEELKNLMCKLAYQVGAAHASFHMLLLNRVLLCCLECCTVKVMSDNNSSPLATIIIPQ